MNRLRLTSFLLLLSGLSLIANTTFAQESEEKAARAIQLQECIALALQNSFEIKLARLDFLIAQTDQQSAQSIFDMIIEADINYTEDSREDLSIFAPAQTQTNTYSIAVSKKLPTGTKLTLSLDDTRQWSDSAYVVRNPAHTAEGQLELRQPLAKNIFGFNDRRDIAVTRLTIQNADLDTQERIESLCAQVEQAYWEWAYTRKSLEINREILNKAEELHRANAQNFSTGLIERGDFLASRANVLLREKDVLVAENQYRRAEEKIKLLMNVQTSLRLEPQEPLEYRGIKFDLAACLNQAFQKRRDFQKQKRQLQIKNIVLETKSNQRWPEIDLVASLAANGIDSRFSSATRDLTSEDNRKYYAALEISLPIENNLANSEFSKARHDKEKAILELKGLERAIVTEIGNAFRDQLTYEANFSKLNSASGLQLEKLNEEEKRFQYGRSSTKRLIDYQQDYLNAQLQLANGMLDLELSRVKLEKALNSILQKYERLL